MKKRTKNFKGFQPCYETLQSSLLPLPYSKPKASNSSELCVDPQSLIFSSLPHKSSKLKFNPKSQQSQTSQPISKSLRTTANNSTRENSWIFDCGATDTMTFERSDISKLSIPNRSHVQTANGELTPVKGAGTIHITPNLQLPNCLYVPNLSHKLLSISHVTKELNCIMVMHPNFCYLQDIQTGEIIGRGTERGGLYYVDEIIQPSRAMSTTGTIHIEVWLWHKRNILQRSNRPQLTMAIFMPTFQILTGINSILFYAPVLFQSMGFERNASLYSSALTGAVLASSTFISIATVDRLGRRVLLITGGIQMIICQVIVAIILGLKFGSDKELSKVYSVVVVVVICLFVMAFGWSWGPLGWTVPSEIFPLETRSAGQSITVAVNMFFTFVIGQVFLSLLCAFKYGIFLFFAGWIAVMTVFVSLFLPETRGVPIEEMVFVWKKHWFWKRIVR